MCDMCSGENVKATIEGGGIIGNEYVDEYRDLECLDCGAAGVKRGQAAPAVWWEPQDMEQVLELVKKLRATSWDEA
jgi:hypothetical protein